MELSQPGQRVSDEWWGIPRYYPQVKILALQMMPDHLHGIIFVKEKMERDLCRIIRGFKTGCNRIYRELSPVLHVATQSQQTGRQPCEDRTHGLLFARGLKDKRLLREGQLDTWHRGSITTNASPSVATSAWPSTRWRKGFATLGKRESSHLSGCKQNRDFAYILTFNQDPKFAEIALRHVLGHFFGETRLKRRNSITRWLSGLIFKLFSLHLSFSSSFLLCKDGKKECFCVFLLIFQRDSSAKFYSRKNKRRVLRWQSERATFGIAPCGNAKSGLF